MQQYFQENLTEEDGNISQQVAQMSQEQERKERQRIIRRFEDGEAKTFFEKEWLKAAKSPASQFDKFAKLCSSFGVKLSLKWSSCPDTGNQQGNFWLSKVLVLSERFVATITTVNTSKMSFTAVLGRINSMIIKHRKIRKEVKAAIETPQSNKTRSCYSHHDSITQLIDEDDRTLYLIHVWQLVKR